MPFSVSSGSLVESEPVEDCGEPRPSRPDDASPGYPPATPHPQPVDSRPFAFIINRQWRICFVWRDGDAYDVEIVDDH